MNRGMGILVGLKEVDPVAYGGWNGRNGCWGCELDVDNIARILEPLNYDLNVIKTADATSHRILQSLRSAAKVLQKGDILVFYYSGHGGQQPDSSGDSKMGSP